jgi:hypothetical protein
MSAQGFSVLGSASSEDMQPTLQQFSSAAIKGGDKRVKEPKFS